MYVLEEEGVAGAGAVVEHVLPSDKRLRCEAPVCPIISKVVSKPTYSTTVSLSFFRPCPSATFLFVTVELPKEL